MKTVSIELYWGVLYGFILHGDEFSDMIGRKLLSRSLITMSLGPFEIKSSSSTPLYESGLVG